MGIEKRENRRDSYENGGEDTEIDRPSSPKAILSGTKEGVEEKEGEGEESEEGCLLGGWRDHESHHAQQLRVRRRRGNVFG